MFYYYDYYDHDLKISMLMVVNILKLNNILR